MSTPDPNPRTRLVSALLVALATASCADDSAPAPAPRKITHARYQAGGTASTSPTLGSQPSIGPDGPCLALDDPRLPPLLDFECGNDERPETGPTEETDASGVRTCDYEVSYVEKVGDCATIGRPLRAHGEVRVATLARAGDAMEWAGAIVV